MSNANSEPSNNLMHRGWRNSRRYVRDASFLFGLVLLITIVALAILAPGLSQHDPYEQDLANRLAPPFWMEGSDPAHWLGTDQLGRDLLARVLYGARISLCIGFIAMLLAAVIGVTLGVIAGYFGGWVDTAISFVITARLALPVILVALAVVALAGASLTVVVLVLGALIWDRFALVARASVQQLRNADFVMAASLQGLTPVQIICQEILPNIANNLIVIATLETAAAIIFEAALSFLGLGVPPPMPSWGRMVAEGQSEILFNSWLITIPGVALFALVLAINLVGDGLRDFTARTSRN
jgi:peptide/nickel transport system permease protein